MFIKSKNRCSILESKLLKMVKIDKNSPIPLYKQIVSFFEELIEEGVLKPYDKVPSEVALSNFLDVSRMTVRKGFEDLEQMGFLYRGASKGTFVSPQKIEQSPTLLIGFAKKMKAQGYEPVTKVVSKRIIRPLRHFQKHLKISPTDSVYEIIRVRGIKCNKRLVLQKTYIPVKLFPDLLKRDLTKPLNNIIRNYGYEMATYWASIEPVIPNEEEIRLLTLESKRPILLIKGVTSSNKQIPLRYTCGFYRSDQLQIVVKEQLINISLKNNKGHLKSGREITE